MTSVGVFDMIGDVKPATTLTVFPFYLASLITPAFGDTSSAFLNLTFVLSKLNVASSVFTIGTFVSHSNIQR